MSSEIDYKSCALFDTHNMSSKIALSFAHIKYGWRRGLVLYSIRETTHISRKIDYDTRALFDTHRNAHVKYDCLKFRTIFSTHRKRTLFGTLRKLTCQARLTTTHVLYSARTKLACQVWMTSCTLFSALRKRICQFRLTTSLTLYSARTENAHI